MLGYPVGAINAWVTFLRPRIPAGTPLLREFAILVSCIDTKELADGIIC